MSNTEVKEKDVLLEVKKLNVSFEIGKNLIHPVRNINLDIHQDEVVAIIGETGCGKSVLGNSILRLLPSNAIVTGKALFNGENILQYSEKKYRKMRGTKIAAIPQNPVSSLDPMMKIGDQVAESVLVHEKVNKVTVRSRVTEILKRLHLGNGKEYLSKYAGELSGGMCQRILIALGTITHPELLIVDEPTKGLDWALRSAVIDIFLELKNNMQCAMLMITHDIAVAYKVADRIAVMYCGELVEIGTSKDILKNPLHPYTQGLLDSMPSRGMHGMKGFAPALTELPEGCKFHPRCPRQCENCLQKQPEMTAYTKTHYVRCYYAQDKSAMEMI